MKESYLWTTLKQGVSGVEWSRSENSAGSGIPDAHGCYRGASRFVELKMFVGKKLHVRASQISWHTRHALAGGLAYFLARKDKELFLYRAITIVQLSKDPRFAKPDKNGKTIAIEPPPEAALATFRMPFPWDGVRDLIFVRPSWPSD